MSQTLGTAPFPASTLAPKPEEFAVSVSEARLIVHGQLLPHIQQSLGTASEIRAYLAQLKITTGPWEQDQPAYVHFSIEDHHQLKTLEGVCSSQ